MPRISFFKTMPAGTLAELNERLIASGFGNLAGATEWLNARGFTISKSAVGEYALNFRQEIIDQADRYGERRMKCLEIASRTPGVTDFVAEATRLLTFVDGA